jgi:hypothetical protein
MKHWTAAVIAAVISLASARPVAASAASIVLTPKEHGSDLSEATSCSGRLHGYIRLPAPAEGTHTLQSRWISPTGTPAVVSRNTVDWRPPRSTAYVWMDFPERPALQVGLDPELEQSLISYNGQWRLDVLWDDKPLLSRAFRVQCP